MNRILKCAQKTSFVHSNDIKTLKYLSETTREGHKALPGISQLSKTRNSYRFPTITDPVPDTRET
jgi:hypothetical protein